MLLGERATFDELLATLGLALGSASVLRADITREYRVGGGAANRALAHRGELPAPKGRATFIVGFSPMG